VSPSQTTLNDPPRAFSRTSQSNTRAEKNRRLTSLLASIRITTYILLVLENTPSTSSLPGVASPRWELYRVLSEPIRLRLLALAAEEELAVGELAELLGESQPNVSRHAAALKQAGLLVVRRQGTRALMQLAADAARDPVVSDALASGRVLCEADGSRARVPEVVRARDVAAREFFARPGESSVARPAPELGAYIRMLSPILPDTRLAVDAGTGDGGLLDVLSPAYDHVIGVDRSEAQLARARERVALRQFENVSFTLGELDGPEVREAVGVGADAVFAARLLHHAPKPARVVAQLANLCRPGGSVVVLDYAHHDDEAMRDQADLWLGFHPAELEVFATSAGLAGARVTSVPGMLTGKGPDAHLRWQLLVATKPGGATEERRTRLDDEPSKRRKATTHG
jgi:ArsR family transcriptional regulator